MKAKKLLSLLLLIVMTISMLVPVQAATDSGKIGDNVTWSFDNSTGTVTISGSGATYDYSNREQAPGNDIDKLSVKKLVVEEGVTKLGDYSCSNFALFDPALYIPKSVIKFGRVSLSFPQTDIYYEGSQSDWEKIEKPYSSYGADATIYFNSYNTSSTAQKNQSVSQNQSVLASTSVSSNGIKVYIDNEIVNFDVQPRLVGGRTMVPLRAIFEGLSATVDWNGDTQTVTAYNEVTIVTATIGEYTMTVNGTKKTMDVAPMVIDSRTLVPARFVAEAFDCDVEWDGNTQTVYITTKPLDYSKVEQDISVTTPSTTPSTTTPSQVTVPGKKEEINTAPEETTSSNGEYKVETVLNVEKKYYGDTTSSRVMADTIQVDDNLYVLRGTKVYQLNLITGKNQVYVDLEKIQLTIDGEQCTYSSNKESILMYNPKKKSFIVTNVTMTYTDEFSDEYCTIKNCLIDITNKSLFTLPGSADNIVKDAHVFNTKGDLLNMKFGFRYPYPKYDSTKIAEVSGTTSSNPIYKNNQAYTVDREGVIISLDEINIDDDTFARKRVYNSNGFEAVGILDDATFVITNDIGLFFVDEDNNIKEKILLETINESDNKTIFCDKYETLWVSSAGDIVFYDLNENVFRRITKN